MLLMLLVPAIPGALAGLLAGSFDVGYYVWFLCVWAVIALVMIGPANKHNANDNTSGVVTLLEIARSLPESQRGKVCFVLFDLEEAGLIGSAAYRKAHKKASDSQLVLNLDCVGDGDHIRFFPTKKLKKDRKKLTSLYKACGYFGKKDVLVHERAFPPTPPIRQISLTAWASAHCGKGENAVSVPHPHTQRHHSGRNKRQYSARGSDHIHHLRRSAIRKEK